MGRKKNPKKIKDLPLYEQVEIYERLVHYIGLQHEVKEFYKKHQNRKKKPYVNL